MNGVYQREVGPATAPPATVRQVEDGDEADGVAGSSSVHGPLGTVVDVHVRAADPAAVDRALAVALAEVDRLERVFTAFDDASDLNRWRRGELDPPPPELAVVVDLARSWRDRSGGAFDPAAAELGACWAAAAAEDRLPTEEELTAARAAMARTTPDRDHPPPWNLNALAKGAIVDAAVATALAVDGVRDVVVNAGGDLRHHGAEPVLVGIEDPAHPHDNAPPLVVVALGDGALATSGGARRGWTIAGRWYSHVLDPRSGRPVDHVASASVVAPDAATADVVATVCSVLAPADGVAFVDGLGDGLDDPAVACFVVEPDGTQHRSRGWADHEVG